MNQRKSIKLMVSPYAPDMKADTPELPRRHVLKSLAAGGLILCFDPQPPADAVPAKDTRVSRIFITGSTDGLGLAAARTLIDEGHQVVLHARSTKRASVLTDLARRSA